MQCSHWGLQTNDGGDGDDDDDGDDNDGLLCSTVMGNYGLTTMPYF